MKKIILLFAAAAIVFAGCTDKEETTASSIELSVESIPAGPEGATGPTDPLIYAQQKIPCD